MRDSHKYENVDLSGQKFNRLTAIQIVPGTRTKWICKCDCGNTKEIYAGYLIRGLWKSCGCLEKENRKNLFQKTRKHGKTNTILYSKWCSMKERCFNPGYKYYGRYGGRGITVCDEWLGEHGFENFEKWAYNAGYDESKHGYEQSLDRIETDGDYCPSNCKWSNQLEQVKNRSNSFLITDIDGEKLTHYQFSLKHGIPANNLFAYRRMKKGLSAKEILDEWNEYIRFNSGDYFKADEAAKYYDVTSATIKKWIQKNLIVAFQCRKAWYIPKGQPKPVFEDRKSDGTFKKKERLTSH